MTALRVTPPPNEEPADEAAIDAADEAALKSPSIFRSDPRWVDAVIALLEHPEIRSDALDVLAVARPPKALEPVLKLAASAGKAHSWNLVNVLVQYKDARIAPLLVRFLDLLSGYWGRRRIYRAIRSYDEPALAAALGAWAKGKKRLEQRDKDEIADLVQFLERDRSLTTGV